MIVNCKEKKNLGETQKRQWVIMIMMVEDISAGIRIQVGRFFYFFFHLEIEEDKYKAIGLLFFISRHLILK